MSKSALKILLNVVWLSIMASNPSLLAEEAPDLWDSRKVDNDQLPLVAYQVKALASAAKHIAKISKT